MRGTTRRAIVLTLLVSSMAAGLIALDGAMNEPARRDAPIASHFLQNDPREGDAQMANEGRENNANWDGIWDVATSITETGWVAEIRIPFRTLKLSDGDSQV